MRELSQSYGMPTTGHTGRRAVVAWFWGQQGSAAEPAARPCNDQCPAIWLVHPQVHAGSKAALAALCPGDLIQAINGESTELMTHLEAQNRIKGCRDHLTLSVSRYAQGRLSQNDGGELGEGAFWVTSTPGEQGLTQPFCFCSLAPQA